MNKTQIALYISLASLMLLAGCKPSTASPAIETPTTAITSPTQAAVAVPSPAYWPTGGWRSTTPEEQGMDSGVLAQMVESLQQGKIALNSLLIIRNGYLVTEVYIAPYTATQTDYIFSVTKSVIGALVGIAIDKGNIKGVDQPLFELLSDQGVKNLDEQKKAITLENLLTQTSGLKCPDNPGPGETSMEASENWVQFMLDQPMEAPPGSKFNYCTGTTHLISAILSNSTGMSAREFANEYLFKPLGIGPITEAYWGSDPQGVTIGGYGLTLTPSDMAKLGTLFLNKGQWEGNSIVPADWVKASTASHSDLGDKKEYGYLWWIDPQGSWYAALGRSGHHVFVYPAENLVVAFTATLPFTNDQDLIPLQNLLNQYILPSIKSDQALPANTESQAQLENGIQALTEPTPTALQPLPAIAADISGKSYTLEENPTGWTSLIFSFDDGANEAQVTISGVRQAPVGLDSIYRIYAVDDKIFPEALRGSWLSQDTFEIEDIKLGLVSDITLQVKFSGETIHVSVMENLSGAQVEFGGSLNQ
jgi:CubicO group peptidase (beta-lactamase class C family)